jgi:antitoxin ParD1/3/4
MSLKVTLGHMRKEGNMANSSIHVSLPEALKRYVEGCVEAGEYASPSDYVRALIRKDRERQAELSALRAELQLGVEQLERGEGEPAAEVFSRLRTRGKALTG